MTPPDHEAGFPGAERVGEIGGLFRWTRGDTYRGDVWTAPPGTTATLEVVGGAGGDDLPPELQWSTRAAAIPSTRGLAFVDGPGSGSVSEDFGRAHRIAEEVAGFATDLSGDEVGPIEVLCFRPETWPEPVATATGVVFEFPHRGGVTVHLTLSVPTTPGVA